MLNERAEDLARQIFPRGVEMGGFYCVGSIQGEAGKTLKIRTRGDRQGTWADYACDPSDRAGKGDMLKLIQLTDPECADIAAAIRWAKGWLRLDHMDPAKLERMRDRADAAAAKAERERATKTERKRLGAVQLWNHSEPMQATPAQAYLEGRGIDFRVLGGFPGAIRYRRDVWNTERRQAMPAMVSLFVGGIDAKPKGVHITYLERGPVGWVKASVDPAKVIWSPAYWGAHIPLNKGRHDCTLRDVPGDVLPYISEGIEDGLSYAMAEPANRVIAAGTLGNIGALLLPDQVREIVLIGQNDPLGSDADRSLEAQIRKHQEADRAVSCLWPDAEFKDFNDQLRGIVKPAPVGCAS